jgi:hypothetical protein
MPCLLLLNVARDRFRLGQKGALKQETHRDGIVSIAAQKETREYLLFVTQKFET